MDPHCILKEQERFYRELYKSSINSPNIGEKISSEISSEECSGLLDSFQSNKTSGNDGITLTPGGTLSSLLIFLQFH